MEEVPSVRRRDVDRQVARRPAQGRVHDRDGNAGRFEAWFVERVGRCAQYLGAVARLDLDHVGPELAEDGRGGVPGDERAEAQHTDTCQRAGFVPPLDTWSIRHTPPGHVVEAGGFVRAGTSADEARRGAEPRAGHRHWNLAPGCGRRHERAARRELAVGDEPGRSVQDPARQTDGLAARDEVLTRTVPHQLRDRRSQLQVALPPDQRIVERGIVELRRLLEHLEERLPVPDLMSGDAERPVRALVGAARGPAHVDQPPEGVEADRVVLLEHEVLAGEDLVHREIDALRTHRARGPERGEHAHRRMRTGFVPAVPPGKRDGRALDRADTRHVPAHRVRDHRRGAPLRVRTRQPEGRDRAHDGVRSPGESQRRRIPTGERRARRRRHHDDVGVRTQSRERARIAVVDHDRALRRVVIGEGERCVRIVTAKGRDPPQWIAVRRLDQHDIGTEVGQQPRAVGADRTAQIEYPDAVEDSRLDRRSTAVMAHTPVVLARSEAVRVGVPRLPQDSSAPITRRLPTRERACPDHSPIGSRVVTRRGIGRATVVASPSPARTSSSSTADPEGAERVSPTSCVWRCSACTSASRGASARDGSRHRERGARVAPRARPGAGPGDRRAAAGGGAGKGQGALAVVERGARPGTGHRAALHPGSGTRSAPKGSTGTRCGPRSPGCGDRPVHCFARAGPHELVEYRIAFREWLAAHRDEFDHTRAPTFAEPMARRLERSARRSARFLKRARPSGRRGQRCG